MRTITIRTRKVHKTAKAYGQFYVKYTDIFNSLTICLGWFAIIFEVRDFQITRYFIPQMIYRLLVSLDKAIGKYEGFSGETAPYCGHAYDGHDGFFTHSHFRESDGGGETKGWFHRYILGVWYSNVDGEEYGFSLPIYNWSRWFYYQAKRWFKVLCIKIEYPQGRRTLFILVGHFTSYKMYRRGGYPSKVSTLHVIRLRGVIPCSHTTI